MKTMLFLSFLALTFTACGAQYGDPTTPPSGNTGGASGGGADAGGAVDTGSADSTPSPTPDLSVAKAGSADCIMFNGRYCDASTAWVVGDCAVEGISWDVGKTVSKNSSGWFELRLTGKAQECHVTLKGCGNSPNTCDGGGTWANYGCAGSPAAPGTQKGGGYMYCGNYLGGDYTCNIAFMRMPGEDPAPYGDLPNGP